MVSTETRHDRNPRVGYHFPTEFPWHSFSSSASRPPTGSARVGMVGAWAVPHGRLVRPGPTHTATRPVRAATGSRPGADRDLTRSRYGAARAGP